MTIGAPTLNATDPGEPPSLVLADFAEGGGDAGWYVVNDNVMGGRSEGGFRIGDGVLRFAGRTDTDGGGFSSIRTETVALDLSNHAGLRLRLRGDGRRYSWQLKTAARWRGDGISYWAEFDTSDDEWITVDIPFSNFIPRYRGMRLDGPPLDQARITGLGLMIYDKLDGPFELSLASVRAFSPRS